MYKDFKTTLNRAWRKDLAVPNVRYLMATLNKSPLRSQHNLLDRLMDVADKDERVIIEAMRSWDPDDVRKFANDFVKQRLSLRDYYEELLFGPEEPDEQPQPEQPQQMRRKTIVIPSPALPERQRSMVRDVDNIPVRNIDGSHMDKHYSEMLKTCLSFFRVIPWIKDKIKAVYVQPIQNLDERFYNFKDVYRYVEGDWGFEEDLFFRPKERYYTMQCMGQNKVQDGEVTSLVWENIEYKFRVGFLTESGRFVVQNEEIMRAETNFLETWVGDYDKKKHLLLNGSPTEADKYLAKSLFFHALANTSGANIKFIYTDDVMDQIFDPLIQDSTTTNDFFDKVVNVVAFIIPNVKLVSSTLFVKRLVQLYYNFNIIGFLTEKEKLPEIYDDSRVPQSTIDYVSEKIYQQKEKLKRDLIEQLITYDLNFITRKPALQPTLYQGKPKDMVIGLPPWKAACANVDDVKDIDDEQLIFYKDVDEVYCFDINNLLDRFSVMDNTNPYTQNQFDPNFVRRILSIYKPQVVQTEPSYEQQQEVVEEGPLIALIEEELIRLENSLLNEVPEFFVKDLVKKCKACNKDVNINDGIETILKNKLVKFCSIKCFEAKQW